MKNITILNNEYKLQNETIFATQEEIGLIFEKDISTISRHIKDIYETGELEEKSTLHKMQIANSTKPVNHYSLDMIIAVGYRVSSPKATKFRIEATKVLKEYLSKGEVVKKDFSKKELALMVIESEEARELAERKVKMIEIENNQKSEIINQQGEIIERKTQIIEKFITMNEDLPPSKVGKALGLKPNLFVSKLRELGYCVSGGAKQNEPYQKYINQGLFKIKYTEPKFINGEERRFPHYYITPKGFNYFRKKLENGDFYDIKNCDL